MFDVKAIGDRVLVKVLCPAKDFQKDGSLIIIPDTVKDEQGCPQWGQVVSVGGQVTTVKEFDEVIVHPAHMQEMNYDGEPYAFVHEKDILAVREEE